MVKQSDLVVIAMHYQNENCHPDGKIKVGIKQDAEWRDEMLATAKVLFAGARENNVPIIHVRLAVRPDHKDVHQNCFIFKQWCEIEAWSEGTWGVEFIEGLEPQGDEFVVTHTRNNSFYNSQLQEIVNLFHPKKLVCSGVSTAFVVGSTVRHASDVGYQTVVIEDACSTMTRDMHNQAIEALKFVADISTTAEVIEDFKKAND